MVIARISGCVDWLFTDEDCGFTDLLAKVDTINGAAQKVLLFLLSSWIYRKKGMVDYNFFNSISSRQRSNTSFRLS